MRRSNGRHPLHPTSHPFRVCAVAVGCIILLLLLCQSFESDDSEQVLLREKEAQLWTRLMNSTGERGSALICGKNGKGTLYYHPRRWLCHFRPCSASNGEDLPLAYSLEVKLRRPHGDLFGIQGVRTTFGNQNLWSALLRDEFPTGFIRWSDDSRRSSRTSLPGWRVYDERPYYLQDLFPELVSQPQYTCFVYLASDYVRYSSQVDEMMNEFPHTVLLGASPQVREGGSLPTERLLAVPAAEGFSGSRAFSKGIPEEEWLRRFDLAAIPGSGMWLIRWRGVTTGQGADFSNVTCGSSTYGSAPFQYALSDRLIAVEGLNKLGKGMDLRFTKAVQGVTSVPAAYFGPSVSSKELISSSLFMIDIDGNSNAWSSLRWKLCSGLPVFRVDSSMGFVEWFYRDLVNGSNILLISPVDPAGDVRRWLEVGNASFFAQVGRNGAAFCDEYLTDEAQFRHIKAQLKDVSNTISSHIGKSWLPRRRRNGDACWLP